MAQRFLQKSPESSIKKTRAVFFRQPRKSSPFIRKKSPIRLPRDKSPSLSFFFAECSKSVNDEIFDEPPSDQDNYVYEEQIEEIKEIEEIEEIEEENIDCNDEQIQAFLVNKKKRKCDTLIERRLRKASAKKHVCTKCARYRLQQYYTEVNCMTCISCLDICRTCGISILPPPLTKARDPQCSNCTEMKKVRKKSIQRLRMQTLRLKRSVLPYLKFLRKKMSPKFPVFKLSTPNRIILSTNRIILSTNRIFLITGLI